MSGNKPGLNKTAMALSLSCLLGLAACTSTGESGSAASGQVKSAHALAAVDKVDADVGKGCEAMTGNSGNGYFSGLINTAPKFHNPTVIDFTPDIGVRSIMELRYRNFEIAGCKTELRGYFGPWALRDLGKVGYERPIGPSMKINPGDVYSSLIINNLPSNATDIPDKTEGLRSAHHDHGKMGHEAFGGHGGKSTRAGYIPPATTMEEPNIPHDFNVTNMHTHGWHVSPADNADNVLIAIPPKSEQDEFQLDHIHNQTIHLPKDHVAGSFWYHPHKHGSTTIQVGSGMSGALLVVDDKVGLGAIPAIKKAVDNTLVFQQVGYGTDGLIEDYSNLQELPFGNLNRPTLVNGQVYPKLMAKQNEVQRWRYVHAGITASIMPAIVSKLPDCATEAASNSSLTSSIASGKGDAGYYGIKNVDVIALDGLPTGTSFNTPNATLAPGYRSDVLVKFDFAKPGETYYLVDTNRAACNKPINGETAYWNSARFVLAQIEVDAGVPQSTMMPTAPQLKQARMDYSGAKGPIEPLTLADMTGPNNYIHFAAETLVRTPGIKALSYWCPQDGRYCEPCNDQNVSASGNQCSTKAEYNAATEKNDYLYIDANGNKEFVGTYMVCRLFDDNNQPLTVGPYVGKYGKCMTFNAADEFVNKLALDSASAWYVSSQGNAGHVFHIHVNPFQVNRKYVEPNYTPIAGDAFGDLVWKDTIVAPAINVGISTKDNKTLVILGKGGAAEKPLTTAATAELLSRYTVFTGAFVQHCHILNHEDQGMMQIVAVEPKDD